jgi:hypothetical protein
MIDRRTRRCLEEAEAKLAAAEPNGRTGAVVLAVFRVWLEEVYLPDHEALRRHLDEEAPAILAELKRQSTALFGDDEKDGLMDLKRQICVASRWAGAIAAALGAVSLWMLHVLSEVTNLLKAIP